jgi:hypothetical protein
MLYSEGTETGLLAQNILLSALSSKTTTLIPGTMPVPAVKFIRTKEGPSGWEAGPKGAVKLA